MLIIACSACQKKLSAKEDAAGKKIKCPGCGQVTAVPLLAAAGRGAPLPNADGGTIPNKADSLTGNQPTQPPLSKPDVTQTLDGPEPAADSQLTDFLAPAQAKDELGRLGKYRILKILGHGGMGVVFKAEDPRLQRTVAIKAMLPALAVSASAGKRFLREAQAMAQLEHDHIVRVYQVDEDRGVPFMAMEFLKGEPLDERLKREQKLPAAEVLRIGREIARGLEVAHKAGLIHRDIKPANIWLEGPEARVKILDFGLARAASQDSGLTQQGAIVGTPAYMSPEQGRGEPVDARCDLFSLGVVLYRLSTGQPPFLGKDTVSTLVSVATREPPPPITVNSALPTELSALVMKLLAKDPAKRIATAAEVVEALKGIEKQFTHTTDSREATVAVAVPVVAKASVDQVLFAVNEAAPAVKKTVPPTAQPAPAPVAADRRSLALIVGAVAVAAFFCLGVIGVGTVLFWPTPHGLIRIEIDDPEIKVSFDDKKLTLKVGDKQDIKVTPGLHGLLVERDGLSFHTEKFELKKGDTVTLKVQWLKNGKLQVVQAGKGVIGSETVNPQAATEAPFFNGKDLTGWEGLIDQYWSVKNGSIVGSTLPGVAPFNTFLCSKNKYKDFELQFQVKLNKAGNSGVQIRSSIHDRGKFAVTGPQADMGDQFWGSLYGENFGGNLKAADVDLVKKILKEEDFNDYFIRCVGKHVTIKLNGAVTVDDDFAQLPDDGIIAWQIHGSKPLEVTFRNIRFKDLSAPPESDAPADVPLAKPEDKVDMPSIPPPPGALVLFDGKSLDAWTKSNGKDPAAWRILPAGFMQVEGGNIITKQNFGGKFKLHVEFRVPYVPQAKGQARGNSGVFLQGRHEIQILDSYGLVSGKGDCGAIYSLTAPRVNACKAPMVWQSYNIVYQAATCEAGKKKSPAVVTIHHNGILIHDNVPITADNTIGGAGGDPCTPGPIILQDHGNPVQFRNIWLVQEPD